MRGSESDPTEFEGDGKPEGSVGTTPKRRLKQRRTWTEITSRILVHDECADTCQWAKLGSFTSIATVILMSL